MKKSLVSLLVVLFVLSIATVAMANPVTLDGSASVQYRHNSNNQWPDQGVNNGENGHLTKMVINGQTDLGSNVKLYARFGMQGVSNRDAQPFDFNGTTYSGDYVAGIDQYGLIYSNGGFTYKLGRQDATIGGTALLYNNNFFVGKHVFVDGITVTGKTGIANIKAVVAKEDKSGFSASGMNASNKLYALSASINPTKDFTVGTTVARYDSEQATNHYAVNAALNVGKATFSGEYAKSDASTDNKAFDIGVSYAMTPKLTTYATYVRVEAKADMGGKTDYENGMKGVHYGATYTFKPNTSLDMVVINDKNIADSSIKYTSYRTTLNFKF